jgi:hypothetical protein
MAEPKLIKTEVEGNFSFKIGSMKQSEAYRFFDLIDQIFNDMGQPDGDGVTIHCPGARVVERYARLAGGIPYDNCQQRDHRIYYKRAAVEGGTYNTVVVAYDKYQVKITGVEV